MSATPSPAVPFDPSAPVRALVIEPGTSEFLVREVRGNVGDEMRRLVGGYLDALTLPGAGTDDVDVVMWVNEEGLLEGLPENPAATALAYGAGLSLGGVLVGRVVVTGLAWHGPRGVGGQVAVDVPDETLDFARSHGLTLAAEA